MKIPLFVGKIAATTSILAIFAVVAVAPALASTPTLSIASVGANSVTLNVYGNANSAVQLFYYQSSQAYPTGYPYNSTYGATLVATIGTTNSAGYFSITVPSTSYNVPSGAVVYVLVGGVQSPTVSWPINGSVACPYSTSYGSTYNNGSYPTQTYPGYPSCPGGPIIVPPPIQPVLPVQPIQPVETGTLSLGVGQLTTVYGQTTGAYVVTSNSNPSIVSASASGNVIQFSGNQIGTASVIVCPASYNYGYPYASNTYGYTNTTTASCADFIVTVTPSLSFSQSNVTLYGVGASQAITLSNGGYGANNYNNTYNGYYGNGYYGGFFVTNNTNPGAVSATVSGNSLVVYAVGYGGSTITVCASGGTCGTVYVAVNGSSTVYQPYYQQQQYYSSGYPSTTYIQPTQIYQAPTQVMRGWTRRW